MNKIPCKHCWHLGQDHIPPGCSGCYDVGWYEQTEVGLKMYCYDYVAMDNLEYLEFASRE